MIDKLAGTWAVLVIAALLWIPACGVQKLRNRIGAKGCNVAGKAPWTYLFGMRPGVERIYLLQAYMQILGLLFCSAGLIAVWFLGVDALRELMMPLGIGILLTMPLGIVDLLKQRK